MKLPYMKSGSGKTKKYVVSFGGINYGESYKDGDFADTMNVSSELYPCISQRAARIKEGEYENPTALGAKDGLVIVDGTTVYYNGEAVGNVSEGKKHITSVGNYIIIFPDKVYYDTGAKKFASMEAAYTVNGLTFTDRTITTGGEDFEFKVGDAVEISGCTAAPENNKTPIIREVSGKTLTFYENTFTAATESGSVTIKRKVPDLDHICENNYRLWGTKGNTIYASKYADPLNFFVYDGLTSDSYYIDVASEGEFTGCIPYSSHICFFKENTLHKLYGSKPSNFQIVTSQVYGVQAGCDKSMCIVNEQLLYKGVNGVYNYTGGVPELISENFGREKFDEACAACDGERYYISMRQGDEWSFFAYDVLRNIWLKEDNTHAMEMAFTDGYVHYVNDKGELFKIDRAASRQDIEWSVTFTPFNETINERKGYSAFHLRVDMAEGSWITAEVKTDNDKKWEKVHTSHSGEARTITIPIVPTRCDKINVRLSGKGECLVKTFVREFKMRSDA